MAWNLVDALSKSDQDRRFFLPLASLTNRVVNKELFDIWESHPEQPDGRTADVALNIRINQPENGLIDEDGLPDPAIRLHAIDKGMVRFQPADGVLGDSLFLYSLTFATPIPSVKWWQRWVDAKCIPHAIIYENIDRTYLETMLRSINVNESAYTLRFPYGVTDENKAEFIEQFLAGTGGDCMEIEAGGYLGVAAPDPVVGPIELKSPRLLTLHVRYYDHIDENNPHPMNPRELFHLLFGDDSIEARNHPLLQRIHEIGESQTHIYPESKRMLLRPPLRTWKRVVWEAEQEIRNHQDNWKPSGSLGPDRFYNDRHPRQGIEHRFSNGPYGPITKPDGTKEGKEINKCNLFVSDICLRAGFRVCVHPIGGRRWNYADSNSYTNLAQRAINEVKDRNVKDYGIVLMGRNEDKEVPWGFAKEEWLTSLSKDPMEWQQLLNKSMIEEGRCLIITGAKRRLNATRRRGIGHIVIVREVIAPSLLLIQKKQPRSEGLQIGEISVKTMEASGLGAINHRRGGFPFLSDPNVDEHPPDLEMRLGGKGGDPTSSKGFIRLHLIELHPGKDPDTKQGLRDLNVNAGNPNLLGTPDENPL